MTNAPKPAKPGDITIRRFTGCPAHKLQIEPADKSWVLWVDDDKPSLWLACDVPAEDVPDDEVRRRLAEGIEVPMIRGYMPAGMMYEVDPGAMAAHEREAIDACKMPPAEPPAA
jgi:hypothetical protein